MPTAEMTDSGFSDDISIGEIRQLLKGARPDLSQHRIDELMRCMLAEALRNRVLDPAHTGLAALGLLEYAVEFVRKYIEKPKAEGVSAG